jgi:hypothetical protein
LATPSALLVTHSPFTSVSGLFQLAPQQGTEVLLSLSQTHIDVNFNRTSQSNSSDLDYSVGNLAVAHALTPNLFLGASIFMAQTQSKSEGTFGDEYSYQSKSTSKGASDPTLSIGTRIDADSVSTLLGLGARIKSGDSTYTSNQESRESESNIKSGGHAVIPAITVFSNSLSSSLIGASVSYTIQLERTSVDTYSSGTVTSKQTGGNALNIATFAETPESELVFGGALAYSKSEGSKSKSENSTEETTSEGLGVTTISGYMKYNINSQVSILPNISYGQFTGGFVDDASKKDIFSASITGKASF